MRRMQIVLVGVAVAAGVAGCSSAPTGSNAAGSDVTAVENVFHNHNQALLSRDFATACSLDAPATNTALEKRAASGGGAATTSCPEALSKIYAIPGAATVADGIAKSAKIDNVKVNGDTATVTWTVSSNGRQSTTTTDMRRVDGQWRVLSGTG